MDALIKLAESIQGMTASEIAGDALLLLVGLSAFIEITPIRINPISAFLKWIGSKINGEVIVKVEKLEKDINRIENTEGERYAKSARTRVLRFGDEIIHGVRHSKEHFDDILLDIHEYDTYCDEHPEFENDRMQLTAQHIKETYRKCMEEHSFL